MPMPNGSKPDNGVAMVKGSALAPVASSSLSPTRARRYPEGCDASGMRCGLRRCSNRRASSSEGLCRKEPRFDVACSLKVPLLGKESAASRLGGCSPPSPSPP